MDSSLKAELDFAPCVNGIAEAVAGDASNTFKCKNADLYHFLSHADLGSTGEGSSSWGWTSDTGREFVAIGMSSPYLTWFCQTDQFQDSKMVQLSLRLIVRVRCCTWAAFLSTLSRQFGAKLDLSRTT